MIVFGNSRTSLRAVCAAFSSFTAMILISGCAMGPAVQTAAPTKITTPIDSIKGTVHGGQGPIKQAKLFLFAAGTAGYQTASTSLLVAGPGVTQDTTGNALSNTTFNDFYVTTDNFGGFTVTGEYTCTSGQQVYAYVKGGDAGSGQNTAIGELAVLGNCPASGTLSTQVPNLVISETSTVAAAYALAGFAFSENNIGTNNTAQGLLGLANAAQNALILNSLNNANGANAFTPAGNGTVPQAKINTLANILAACINGLSTSVPCTTLFANAPGTSFSPPTNTATAIINIAQSPSTNVAALFGVASSYAQFSPALTTAPHDFSLIVSYVGSGSVTLHSPTAVAIDAGGYAWVSNYGATTVDQFTPAGVPNFYYSYGHLQQPYSIAIAPDTNLYMLAANTGTVTPVGAYFYQITVPTTANASGSYFSGLPANALGSSASDSASQAFLAYGNGTASGVFYLNGNNAYLADVTANVGPYAYASAIDTNGVDWITSFNPAAPATTGSATLLKFTGAAGTYTVATCTGTNYTAGSGVIIDHGNNVWVADYANGALVKFANACTYTANYSGGSLAGTHPVGLAVDGSSNLWTISTSGSLFGFNNSGNSITGTSGLSTGLSGTFASPVVDPSGNIWFVNTAANTINQVIGVATPVVTPIAAGIASNTLGTRP